MQATVLNQPCQIFLTFHQNVNFNWLKIKFPDFSLILNFFLWPFPDLCGNSVRTQPNNNPTYHVYTCICILKVLTWSWETLMSSITSGGITSTTLDCSLGMSTVDSASEKYKQKNKFVSKTTSCGIQLCLELPFVVFAKSSKKFPALYTVSMFPPAFFSALNTIYMCVRVALLLHFLSALCTI